MMLLDSELIMIYRYKYYHLQGIMTHLQVKNKTLLNR